MLERSERSTLVIEMDFSHYNSSSVSKTAVLIKDVITKNTDRIREIELRGIDSSQLTTLLYGIPDSLRLTSLVLTTSRGRNGAIP